MRYEMKADPRSDPMRSQYVLQKAVNNLGLPIHFDKELLFWAHHFDGKDWATCGNGHQKGGTLRFKEGHVRLPKELELCVYETEEWNNKMPPRAIVNLAKVTVCPAREISQDELTKDGFIDHEQAVASMQKYYPTISLDSVVSFYTFGKTEWFDWKD